MATDPISTKSGRRPTGRGVAALLLAGLFWLLKRAFHRTSEVIRAGVRAPAPALPPDVNPRSVESGHEVSDVAVGKIFFFGAALGVSVLAVLVVALLYFRLLGRWERRTDADRPRREPAAASLVAAERDNFAGPLLQVRPEEELQALHDNDRRTLDTYGWLDRPAGIVRLPISRAMDLIAERGLPPVSPGKTAVQIQQERALPENRRDDLRQPTFAPSAP